MQKNAKEIEAWLVRRVADELKRSFQSVDPKINLQELGLDSLAAVGISADLEKWLGRSVSSTIFYDYETLAEVSDAIAAEAEA
jgi:acyl carrier protein